MEAAELSETSASCYQTTQRHIPKDGGVRSLRLEGLRYYWHLVVISRKNSPMISDFQLQSSKVTETWPRSGLLLRISLHLHNKNKLNGTLCIVTNTTIFLIVHLLLLRYNYMFRPSMLAIFRLYMKHLTISYMYMWVGSLQFVGWGGCEISFCVCRRGVDRVCLGGVVKISFMSTNSYVYK